ncbi:MAG: thioesterase family protein [Lachnospiraceae bacterium]|nr:thioesterase family protein [Lachnospiraceae bacterium]
MYNHTVQYYETDKMGITHHSNYIRWMEEARIDFLKQIGWDFVKLENLGIVSPVVSVNCNYKATTTFADCVKIEVSVTEFKGIKLVLNYEMTNEDGKVVCDSTSTHCFLDKDGKPINLKKQFPDFYEVLFDLANK